MKKTDYSIMGRNKRALSLLFLSLLFLVISVSAAKVGTMDSKGVKLNIPSSSNSNYINYSQVNVNNSDYLDGYDSSQFWKTSGVQAGMTGSKSGNYNLATTGTGEFSFLTLTSDMFVTEHDWFHLYGDSNVDIQIDAGAGSVASSVGSNFVAYGGSGLIAYGEDMPGSGGNSRISGGVGGSAEVPSGEQGGFGEVVGGTGGNSIYSQGGIGGNVNINSGSGGVSDQNIGGDAGNIFIDTGLGGTGMISNGNEGIINIGTLAGRQINLGRDNIKLFFGTNYNSSIYYDGSDFIINTLENGTSRLKIIGGMDINGTIYVSPSGQEGNVGIGTSDADSPLTIQSLSADPVEVRIVDTPIARITSDGSDGGGLALYDEGALNVYFNSFAESYIRNHDLNLDGYNLNLTFGINEETKMSYSNGHFNINPKSYGNGTVKINGNVNLTNNNMTDVNYIKLNEVSGACDLEINHSICSNQSGTYIVG